MLCLAWNGSLVDVLQLKSSGHTIPIPLNSSDRCGEVNRWCFHKVTQLHSMRAML